MNIGPDAAKEVYGYTIDKKAFILCVFQLELLKLNKLIMPNVTSEECGVMSLEWGGC